MSRRAFLFVLLAGCESAVVLPPGEDASTGSAAASTNTGAGVLTSSSTGSVDPTTTTTTAPGSGETSTGPVVTDTDCSFLCDDSSDSGIAFECSIWDQDCPPGEKCSPWQNRAWWDGWRCVPVAPHPDEVGEVCTVKGAGTSGLDSCALGAMCWDVDPKTNIGTCVPHCVGSELAPLCAEPSRHCIITYDGALPLCHAQCDPLPPASCPEGDGCYPIQDAFICAPDASGKDGGLFEPCEYINGCEAGLICGAPENVGDLCGVDAPGCCVPPCNLEAPSCPPMTTCIPYFEDEQIPPGYPAIGMCGMDAG